MDRYSSLMKRVKDGECILIDGATGTEVERRGVPQNKNAWNGGAALSHPDIVRKIHQDYINLGAEIVISNTFSTNKHALSDAELGHDFEALNERAVKLAVEARKHLNKDNVLVAGGISYWTWTDNKPSLNELNASITQQAKIMADAGADLIMLEMMANIEQMMTTLKAAQASELPVWVGLSCEPDQSRKMCLLDGDSLEDTIRELKSYSPDVINIMHTEVEYIDQCLDILQNEWDGHIGVYAHSGTSIDGDWTFDNIISAEEYCAYSSKWKKRGINFIGGCCGVHTGHIDMMHRELFTNTR